MLDTSTMSSSIMAKNYSRRPLKKRPVQFIKEEISPVDSAVSKIEIKDEPENLSTKPEDLSLRINSTSSSMTDSPPSTPIKEETHNYPIKTESVHRPPSPMSPAAVVAPPVVPRFTGGAFHRVQPVSPEPIHYAPNTWHRNIAPAATQLPVYHQPTYFPLGYPYGNEYPPYYPLYPSPPSPYAPRDSSCSPPQVNHQRQPLAPLALIPEPRRLPYDRSSLSPASSTGAVSLRSHSPTSSNEPADLSPPPSVTSLPATRVSSTRHQCDDCGKSYSTYSGLTKHRQFHCAHGDGPKRSFSCKYCDKVYVSLGALKMHIRTHTLPCKCYMCGKAFSRPWLLQGHIRTHTGEKPFECPHCNRAFADRSNLRAHLQTHSDVKKYSCTTCSKTFSRMSLLTKHSESGCTGANTPMYAPAHLEHKLY